ATDKQLVAFGRELLDGVRLIGLRAKSAGSWELDAYLSGVSGVSVVQPDAFDCKHDDHLLVHEAVGEGLCGLYDYCHRAIELREGYYSVACDYWLAWYLQWPFFRPRFGRDIFRPYYELWARGHGVAFQGERLCLARAD